MVNDLNLPLVRPDVIPRMRIILLDNFDSFTWNLHHLLEPHADVAVVRNDAISVEEASRYDRIVLSPGPGLPSEAGVMMELLRKLMPSHPILGVCLGMQGMVEACGGRLYNQTSVKHGVSVPCVPEVPIDPLFSGILTPFEVGLYHSWAADPQTLPSALNVIARSADGVIMGIRHCEFDCCGIQFHPESIMTRYGADIIANWLGSGHDRRPT